MLLTVLIVLALIASVLYLACLAIADWHPQALSFCRSLGYEDLEGRRVLTPVASLSAFDVTENDQIQVTVLLNMMAEQAGSWFRCA